MVNFRGNTAEITSAQRFSFKEGKLWNADTNALAPLDCNRMTWFYFSHRDDLLTLDQSQWLKRDGSGLPLLGPILVPGGIDAAINLDIWQQKDWAIVRGVRVDGVRLDKVEMTEWKEDYVTGKVVSPGIE